MQLKKRSIVTVALILALGSAVFINWYTSKPETKRANADSNGQTTVNLGDAQFVNATVLNDSDSKDNEKDYFAQTKIKRQKSYDEAMEMLKKIIDDKNADEKSKSHARDTLTQLSNAIKMQSDIETLIKAKIKSDCAVLINNGKVDVIVSEGILNDNTILKIQEIVIGQTGISPKNVTIIELNS